MNRIINQFFGCGDILFLVPLIRKWKAQGDQVLWPIIEEYLPLQKNFPDIHFVDKRSLPINYDCRTRFQWNGYTVEPLRWADLHKPPPANCMRAKYDLYNEDFMMWRQLTWTRDFNAEEKLFNLMCPEGEYNLISDTIGSREQGQYKIPIEVDNGLPNVFLQYVHGYNLLDWHKIIANANYIHVRGSSINYMLDVMELKAREVHVYKRFVDFKVKNGGKYVPRENHYNFYNYLMKGHDYIWHH